MSDQHSTVGILRSISGIRAIALWQPWASLVFVQPRVKQYETRSWLPPKGTIGTRIAIHAAAKKITKKGAGISEELHEICLDAFGCSYNHTLPYGGVIGTAFLRRVVSTEAIRDGLSEDELATGDWSDLRYGWELTELNSFPMMIRTKGFQRTWRLPKFGQDVIDLVEGKIGKGELCRE